MTETIVEKFVGIDVSKSTLDVCIEPDVQTLHVAYDEAGIKQIVVRLKSDVDCDGSDRRIGSAYRN